MGWLIVALCFLSHWISAVRSAAIYTYAGDGRCIDDKVEPRNASFRYTKALWMAPNGDLFISDTGDHRIRVLNATTGLVEIFAGNQYPNFNGDDIPATSSSLASPQGMFGDTAGHVYVCSTSVHTVRKIDIHTRLISRYAGIMRTPTFNGDGLFRLNTTMRNIRSLYIYNEQMFVAEGNGHRIRRIDMIDGIASTYVGTGTAGNGYNLPATECAIKVPMNMWFNSLGDLFFIDSGNYRVKRVDALTKMVTVFLGNALTNWTNINQPATEFSYNYAECLVGDRQGNLYFSSDNNNRVIKINATGYTSYYAGNGGWSYIVGPEGESSTQASLSRIRGCWWDDATESLLTTEYDFFRVRNISSTSVHTVAGSGTWCLDDKHIEPIGLWMDSQQTIFYTASNHVVRKVSVNGDISTVAGIPGRIAWSGEENSALQMAFNNPTSLSGDHNGLLYISDTSNGRVRVLNFSSGIVRTMTGRGWWCEADIIQTNITALSAYLCNTRYIQYHNYSNSLFLADMGNQVIRRVDLSTNIIFTVVGTIRTSGFLDNVPATLAQLNNPWALYVNSVGDIYIADNNNARIRKVSADTEIITTVAGNGVNAYALDYGPAMNASLSALFGLCADKEERNLYITGSSYGRLRRLNLDTEKISLVAGDGVPIERFTGDSISATNSQIGNTYGCVVDGEGNLYFGEVFNYRIRMITVLAPTSQPSSLPSGQPTSAPTQPTSQPSSQPSGCPSAQPSVQPTAHPSAQPSARPSSQPSSSPSAQPSGQPSAKPSAQPSDFPSGQPSMRPSAQPSARPSAQPTTQPTSSPSAQPSTQPSTQPTRSPSGQPTTTPSVQPSTVPSSQPSTEPSAQPSTQPSAQPSVRPSGQPTTRPSSQPTASPSAQPYAQPSAFPSITPSAQPTAVPSLQPTVQPSAQPSVSPSSSPTSQPFAVPSAQPTVVPSSVPSSQPSVIPTSSPSSQPSTRPSAQPTAVPSRTPSSQPTRQPNAVPSAQPSGVPSSSPSAQPSAQPTTQPSAMPSVRPSAQPTAQPSVVPSSVPSTPPTSEPSSEPSASPTTVPSSHPSAMPSAEPSAQPTTEPTTSPSSQPTEGPSAQPTGQPSTHPTSSPSTQPTTQPSAEPTGTPSSSPSALPSAQPSSRPSAEPTVQPSSAPSIIPTAQPMAQPSAVPSSGPSVEPSSEPSVEPSAEPSSRPNAVPSARPSTQPSAQPSDTPSSSPSAQPSSQPSSEPSALPSTRPSSQPSSGPSAEPSEKPSSAPSAMPSAQPSVAPTNSPRALKITRALLSADASFVTLSLSQQTNRAGFVNTFPCEDVLRFDSDDRIPLLCMWTTHSEIRVFAVHAYSSSTKNERKSLSQLLGASVSLRNSSSLSVYEERQRKGDALIQTRTNTAVVIIPSAMKIGLDESDPSALVPVVSLSMPSTVSACKDWEIDLSASMHAGMDPWKSVSVTVRSNASVSEASERAKRLQTFLNSALRTEMFVTIPSYVLNISSLANEELSLSFELCNHWSRCNNASKSLRVIQSLTASKPVMEVLILGADRFVVDSTQALTLSARITSHWGCNSSHAHTQTEGNVRQRGIVWTVENAHTKKKLFFASQSTTDTVAMSLSSNSLLSGAEHTVCVSVNDIVWNASATHCVHVITTRKPLSVRISPSTNQMLPLGSSLSLSAFTTSSSSSYSDGDSRWEFRWFCETVRDSEYSDSTASSSSLCPLSLSDHALSSSAIVANATSSAAVNLTARIFVEVRDRENNETATSSVFVTVVRKDSPMISFDGSSSLFVGDSLRNVDISASLTLSAWVMWPAQVSLFSAPVCVWTVDDPLLDLSSQAISAVNQTISLTKNANDKVPLTLRLRPHALTPRSAFAFSLLCGSAVRNTIHVRTNSPPLGGLLSVSPSQGTELTTRFLLLSTQWVDEDLPLYFQFGLSSPLSSSPYSSVSDASAAETVLREQALQSFYFSLLPGGDASRGHALNLSVTAIDSVGSRARVFSQAEVTPLQTAKLRETIIGSLSNASTATLSSADLSALIGASTAALNKVTCAAAPDCAVLNRVSCVRTENTCGECVSGFVGESGDKNTLCVASSALPSSLVGDNSNTTCVRDSDCVHSWQRCEHSVCVNPPQRCPRDCSSRGECVYKHKISQRVVQQCSIFDATCAPLCVCEQNYLGNGCEFTAAELEQEQSTRALLLDAIDALVSKSTWSDAAVNENTVSESVSRVGAVVRDEFDLSASSSRRTTAIARSLVIASLNTSSVSINALSGLLSAVDTTLRAQLLFANHSTHTESTADLQASLDVLRLFSAKSVESDASLTYVASEFRLISAVQTAKSGEDISLSVPQTTLERLSSARSLSPNTVRVTGGAGESVEVIEIHANLWRGNASASQRENENENRTVFLTTTPLSHILSVRARNAETALLRLQRVVSLGDTDTETETVNTTCVLGEISSHTHVCAQSGVSIVHECDGRAGVHSSQCPQRSVSCSALDTLTQTVDTTHSQTTSRCRLLNETETHVWCECDVTLPAETRRSLSSASTKAETAANDALVDSGALTVALMVAYVGEDFADSFQSAPALFLSGESAQRVVTVLAMFCALWGFGGAAFLSLYWKKTHAQSKEEEAKKQKIAKRVASIAPARSTTTARTTNNAHTTAASSSIDTDAKLNALHKLVAYVDSVIPSIYLSESSFKRIKEELLLHHDVLSLLMGFSSSSATRKLDYAVLLQVLTVQTMLMFLLALLYDLQAPSDDGSCLAHTTESACLRRKSLLDNAQTYCQWTPNDTISSSSEAYPCVYQSPYFSFTVGFYIAVVSSLFTAVVMRPLEMLFDLLSAPTEEFIRRSLAVSAFSSVSASVSTAVRRASTVAVQLKNSVLPVNLNAESINEKKTNSGEEIVATRFIPPYTAQAYRQARLVVTSIGERLLSQTQTRIAQRASSRRSLLHDGTQGETERGTERDKVLTSTAKTSFSLDALQRDIACQREVLRAHDESECEHSAEMETFDRCWGLDPHTGRFPDQHSQKHSHAVNNRSHIPVAKTTASMMRSTAEIVAEELSFVETRSQALTREIRTATDSHKGLEILQLFVLDLLGRDSPAAKIFRSKAEEDYRLLPVVSQRTQYCAVAAILLINGFFVFYAVLKGFVKGPRWQRTYLFACLAQLLVEILLFQTLECVWINVVVPSCVRAEVHRMHLVLQAAVKHLLEQVATTAPRERRREEEKTREGERDKDKDGEKEGAEMVSKTVLNAPDFLFLSTQLAKQYPQLMESMIVLAYQTYLPGEIARKWTERQPFSQEEVVSVSRKARLLAPLLSLPHTLTQALVSFIAAIPFEVQRMVLRFLGPFLLGGLIVIFWAISQSLVAMVVLGVAVSLSLCYLAYRVYRSSKSTTTAEEDSFAVAQTAISLGVLSESVPLRRRNTFGNNKERERSWALPCVDDTPLHTPALALHTIAENNEHHSSARDDGSEDFNSFTDSLIDEIDNENSFPTHSAKESYVDSFLNSHESALSPHCSSSQEHVAFDTKGEMCPSSWESIETDGNPNDSIAIDFSQYQFESTEEASRTV